MLEILRVARWHLLKGSSAVRSFCVEGVCVCVVLCSALCARRPSLALALTSMRCVEGRPSTPSSWSIAFAQALVILPRMLKNQRHWYGALSREVPPVKTKSKD